MSEKVCVAASFVVEYKSRLAVIESLRLKLDVWPKHFTLYTTVLYLYSILRGRLSSYTA